MSASIVTKLSAQVNVTLRVDMLDEIVSGDGVHVAGSFQGWDPASTLMTPPLIGFIYEITFQANPGDHVLYKFINGNDWPFAEAVSATCGEDDGNGGFNRYFDVPSEDVIVDLVCFGSCLPCILPQKNITFQVDMSNETVSGDGIHLAGTFNGWSTFGMPMTLTSNNIYEVTIVLGEGEYHEFKYMNGNDWGFDESVPGACASNNNRHYTVPAFDETLPLVCFGSCDPCTTVSDVSITFQVDMSEQTVVPEGVHIAGSMQGWDPSGTLMNDLGNGIWSYSFVLQSGSYHQYKFLNGLAWGDEESVPGTCAQNNNRFLTVPVNETTLPPVCFGSCVICEPPLYDVTFSVDMSTQIVSELGVHLAGSFQSWNPGSTEMTNIGSKVYQITLPLGEGALHEYKFINGNDFAGAEYVPGECGNFDGNREFVGPSVNTVLPTVCFNECVECTTSLFEFELSVMLEGPFNGIDMNTTLFDSEVLPENQPFNTVPWNYNGGEFLTAAPESGVVDWVYIQLRETDGDASTATPDKMVDHQAAILLSDGSIATPDGNPIIYFSGDFTENLYLLVYNRNHLAVMSSTALIELIGVYTYNFSDALSKAYLDGQKSLGGGMYGMIGGDSDGNSTIDENDIDVNWTDKAGGAGYFGSDLNLDTQVDNADKNDIWEPNLNSASQLPN
jgi:hypothetical protein